jgi:hypothetical protein
MRSPYFWRKPYLSIGALLVGVCAHRVVEAALCVATITNVNVPAPTTTYIPFPTPGGYRYTWNWTVNYSCSNETSSNCGIVVHSYVALYNPATDLYDNASVDCDISSYGGCNANWYQNLVTSYPSGGLSSGTKFVMRFYVGAYHPNIGLDCPKQNPTLAFDEDYTVP